MATKSKRGGKRKNAGRKATKSTLPGGAEFADRVLGRVKELKLAGIKDHEDYALQFLKSPDLRIRKEVFMGLLFYKHGKPAQPVEGAIDPDARMKVTVVHIGKKNSRD